MICEISCGEQKDDDDGVWYALQERGHLDDANHVRNLNARRLIFLVFHS